MELRSYSYKPAAKMWGKGAYHIGMELEVEAPDRDARLAGLELAPNRQRLTYAKHDGSLGVYGWELVTHPIGCDTWLTEGKPVQRIKALVEALQGLGYNSHNGGRCGLHLHVSHSAFTGGARPRSICNGRGYKDCNRSTLNGFRGTHVYFFWRLINGFTFKRLSQRSSFSFCKQATELSPSAFARQSNNGDRYVACNFTSKTVEVRIFRGNLRWERVMKAVESVVCAIEFTRGLTWRDGNCASLDQLFLEYVVAHRKDYPNLHSYLVECGLIRSADIIQEQEDMAVVPSAIMADVC